MRDAEQAGAAGGVRVRAQAPGRVNLIGDHTDYTGGLCLPMAIDLGTTVDLWPTDDAEVRLRSDSEPEPAVVPLQVADPAAAAPEWARYVAGVVAELQPRRGGRGEVRTTLPLGAGLASSAALEVAVALVLGATGSPLEIALLCQRAEQRASGVPCGVMDQLACIAAVEGHALLLDCTALTVEPVLIPAGAVITVVHSGEPRRLAVSEYAERRAACERVEGVVGPLRAATADDVERIVDPVLRRRARHVVTENARVRQVVEALRGGDLRGAGALLVESHASLRDDFEVSTPRLDALVETLRTTPGVFGARLTGAGFGGCVVVLGDVAARVDGWRVRASAGARVQRLALSEQ